MAFFLSAPRAHSAEPAHAAPPSCGASSSEAIAAAEKALAESSPEGQKRALACLIAAVKVLEAERLDVVQGKEKTRLLLVPRNP
jgi:hypothetical protein